MLCIEARGPEGLDHYICTSIIYEGNKEGNIMHDALNLKICIMHDA